MWSMFFGGATVEGLTDQLRQAVNDPSVKAIILDVDSPGGDVEGIDELASEIYQARKQKPITAVSNSMCASAAYYLASQASEILVSPSSLTGSIGVYTVHEDDSKCLDNAGVKLTMIKYGENKGEGNPYEPLTDTAREHLQEMVDTFGQQFEKAVARGRGIKAEDVHKKFGQGRVYDAKKAVQLGMADRVGTFDDALAKHGATRSVGAGARSVVLVGTGGVPLGIDLAAGDLAASADVGDPDDDCSCTCEECKAGNCDECSHDACACEGCTCDAATKARKAKTAIERRKLEVLAA
jgi:signal peptide peptidase SppA